MSAPERIWVARNSNFHLVVNFSQHDLPGEVEYVRADLYEMAETAAEGRMVFLRKANEEIRDLRAAIAQMSCDMKLAQTHITNAIDEAKRLAEGEP